MAKTVIFNILCLALIFGTALSQRLNISGVGTGICNGGLYKSVIDLKKGLGKCVSVTGSLELMMEKSKEEDFKDAQLNNLREITDYLVIYRVKGLESVGQLFPHLTRIRGNKLLDNFALIVYDNPSLREIGLFSLIKIDRGGVIVGVVPQACYVETVDWKSLAPQARHVIMPPDGQLECNMPCRCTEDSQNRCWNNKKCQLFLEGPEKCHDQCLGCRKTVKDDCFACRNYTYKFNCVSECPPETFLIPDNQYCITKQECHELGRLIWNTTCLSECPADYSVNNKTGESVCEPCSTHCEKNCSSLYLTSLGAVQNAEKCVYINGSISIRLGNVPGIMRDLKKYLSRIEEVSQYISIEASDVIMSLDFLPSLRVIKGENLVQNKYSLYIKSNHNLQRLFTPNVTKNLIVKNGAPMFQKNPVLCMNIIDEIKDRFPTTPSEIDIPLGSNGYRGGCEDVHFNFSITATSETSVKIRFNTEDSHIHYTALYVRVSPEVQSTVVPESCSEFEWHDADVLMVSGENYSIVELNSLQPASTYALCIEIYDPDKKRLSRSNILNFKTLVGAPELPFIFELVADSSNLVVIRWVDHKDYAEHITHYELDVMLIEMNPNVSMVDYCQFTNDFSDNDDIRHALVRRPPPQYHRGCESMCGVLSSTTPGAMTEEFFDVCDDKHFTCNDYVESVIETNTTCRNYIRTLILNIQGPKNKFQVVGLAPFSDYRFRLRACINNLCSRSARGVVRTKSSANADKISNVSANVNKSSGMVTVKWEAPEDTNGPILTYFVEILPKIKYITNIMPQVWCVRANETSIVVKSVIIPKYLIRVCLRTLASSKSCSDYVVVKLNVSMPSVEPIPSRPMPKIDLLWTGVLFGILVYIMSFLVGWLRNMRRVAGDVAPLIDSSSSFHVESEAPIIMLRNSVPYNTRSFEEIVLY